MNITLDTVLTFGKFKGKLVSDLLIETESEVMAKELRPIVSYFVWIALNTQHTLDLEVEKRMKSIMSLYRRDMSSSYSSNHSGLDHYNDIGAISDLSFQDCFGDFGF